MSVASRQKKIDYDDLSERDIQALYSRINKLPSAIPAEKRSLGEYLDELNVTFLERIRGDFGTGEKPTRKDARINQILNYNGYTDKDISDVEKLRAEVKVARKGTAEKGPVPQLETRAFSQEQIE